MPCRWTLYQCPSDQSIDVAANVRRVAEFLLWQLFGWVDNLTLDGCWTWGDGRGDSRTQLHMASGEVGLRNFHDVMSLAVVTLDARVPAFGLVIVGSPGRLARITRELWAATHAELGPVPRTTAVEIRGSLLDGCFDQLQTAAGVGS